MTGPAARQFFVFAAGPACCVLLSACRGLLYVCPHLHTWMVFSIAKRFTFREISSSWQNVSKLPFAHLT